MARKKQINNLTASQMDDLRTLIEALDLVPLSVYPPELRPIALDYYKSLNNVDVPFDTEIERVSVNIYLRNRKKIKPQITNDDLLLII